MLFPLRSRKRWPCALALAILSLAAAPPAHAQVQSIATDWPLQWPVTNNDPDSNTRRNGASYPYLLSAWTAETQSSGTPLPAAVDLGAWDGTSPHAPHPTMQEPMPAGETWIAPPNDHSPYVDADVYISDPRFPGRSLVSPFHQHDAWFWQVLPDGLIYRSYQAGVHEPRISVVLFQERDGRSLWDATLGGRAGLLRYGNCNTLRPQGWQLDIEAAALARLALDDMRDMETVDYRAGVPLTYGIGDWQFKIAYYHLSSHLADEHAINNLGSLDERINYVRDALVLGASYYVNPAWRVYSEIGYAFNADGGAEPWEIQFGTEYSQPGPTGLHGTPFVALNGHLREENEFSGDGTLQAGWLWRGRSGQTTRVGFHYFNGKSSQYQTFDDSEEQIGVGLWYDY